MAAERAGEGPATTGPAAAPGTAPGELRYRSPAGRWVLVATVLGSSLVFLDGSVVNVALPAIASDFGAGLASLQWTVNAYTLTLAGLLLLGGSLGDHYGRRRTFVTGIIWFALASLVCGLAPNAPALAAARALQGIGAALLTPGSLAIIEATFRPSDRAPAIGAWSGLGGVATAFAPLLGGYLTEAVSWRLVFLINLPFTAVALWAAIRHVPESRDPAATRRLDLSGAALAALGLAGLTYALTDGPPLGWTIPSVLLALVGGVLALAAFVLVERSSRHPMLPLDLFRSVQFSAANMVTFLIYGALSGSLFLLPIQLQRVVGMSPLRAGSALMPVTIVMLLLSASAGRLAQRIGPRLPMTLGPLAAAVGLALMVRIVPGAGYWRTILPAVVVFALGLSLTVAPLTATVLAAASAEHAGVASAVNNAVARAAGLLAVATLPVVAGLAGSSALSPGVFASGFRTATWISACLVAAGGLLAFLTIRSPVPDGAARQPEPCSHCPVDAPLLRAPEPPDAIEAPRR
ncbi:MAG TPA: DHA2 family efflux MFS transporter permease subunit [Actinomycetes bacterium]|nr:DHA2 family efflux MFS transporter permease subunit [Actinomycetes bacterium]